MQKINKLFSNYLDTSSPSCSVVIIKDGNIDFECSFGYASLEHSIKACKSTIYDSGSLSKHFIGYALAKLITLGKLSRDDTLRIFYEDVPKIYEGIKIDHLLHHTSGLPSYNGYEYYVGNFKSADTVVDIIFKEAKLNFEPGSQFKYCNTGYLLLAQIIEKVTSKPLETWLKTNLFDYYEMQSTFLLRDYDTVIENLATPYKKEEDYVSAFKSYLYGASAIHSSIEDLGKWIIHLDSLILEKNKLADIMFDRGKLSNGKDVPYGFGCFLGKCFDRKVIEHGGECEGYRSAMSFLPEERLGIGILSNDASLDLWKIVRDVYNAYINGQYPSDSNNEVSLVKNSIRTEVIDFSAYEGKFLIEPGAVVEVYQVKDELRWRIQGITGFDFPLHRINKFEFTDQDGDPVIFEFDDASSVTSLKLQWSNGLTEAKIIREKFDLEQYKGTYNNPNIGLTINGEAKDDRLLLIGNTFGQKTFIPFAEDSFTGEDWWNNQLYIIRDEHDRVTGFEIIVRDESEISFKKTN